MNVAINISPLFTGHKFRGTGTYTRMLYENLQKFDKDNTYIFFHHIKEIPENIDLIHYPFFDPFSFSFSIKHLKKTITTIHDLIPLVFPEHFPAGIKGKIIWGIQQTLLKNTKGIITDSNSSKRDIVSLTGVPEKRIQVVYLAAEKEFVIIRKLKIKYNLPEKFVLYVGDVTWNKNIPRLIKAIKMTTVPLVLVGKVWSEDAYDKNNPWNKDRVLVDALTRNDKRFIRLGFIPFEDIVQLYNAATVSVMPSLYEGFGLPVLEAMQCGCPVITTERGSLKEISNGAAYIVDPEDIQSISNGIEKVAKDNILQRELSEKGIKQAKKFSLESTIRQTIRAYLELSNL